MRTTCSALIGWSLGKEPEPARLLPWRNPPVLKGHEQARGSARLDALKLESCAVEKVPGAALEAYAAAWPVPGES